MRAVTERIRRLLALDVVFSQNNLARQLRMIGIDAGIHDGNDDGRIAHGCIPGLGRSNELRRPLGDVAGLGGWIGCGVIGIIRDKHRLHDIVEGHVLDAGVLREARHEESQGLSSRVNEVYHIIVRHLYETNPLLQARQSQLEPGIDRRGGVSVRT